MDQRGGYSGIEGVELLIAIGIIYIAHRIRIPIELESAIHETLGKDMMQIAKSTKEETGWDSRKVQGEIGYVILEINTLEVASILSSTCESEKQGQASEGQST